MTSPVQGDQLNAYNVLVQMLQSWGLEGLAPDVLKFIQDGYTQTQIPVLLQDTQAYKQRFSGNEQRRAKGLPVLSPAEYLSVESSYRQVMQNAGLPTGFYDQADDFTKWIGNDVSPAEVQRRVDEASDSIYRLDANTQQAFMDYYGVGAGELTAYILDADRGRDAINRVVHGGRIAGAAAGYGVNLTQAQAENLGGMSTQNYVQEAQQFGQLAGVGQRLSDIYAGEDYGVNEAGAEVFQGSTDAQRRRKALQAREQAEFSGGGQNSATALGSQTGSY